MSEPPNECFSSLLRSDLSANTDAFLSVYREGVSRSPQPVTALTRFLVESLVIDKDEEFYEHELIAAKVDDVQTQNQYDFFIERNGTQPQILSQPMGSHTAVAPIASASAVGSTPLASTSPISANSVVQEVENLTSRQLQQAAPSAELYPLLPMNETLPSADHPLPSISTLQSKAPPSQHSYYNKFTLASAKTVHLSVKSKGCIAEDRILGRGNFVTDPRKVDGVWESGTPVRGIGRVVHQIAPKDPLPFYELGILVDVVHNEALKYHVLSGQCYWFATTICLIVVLLYGDKLNSKNTNTKTPNEYLPNLAGRWKNMLIVAPEDEAIRRIITEFTIRQEKAFSEVSFRQF